MRGGGDRGSANTAGCIGNDGRPTCLDARTGDRGSTTPKSGVRCGRARLVLVSSLSVRRCVGGVEKVFKGSAGGERGSGKTSGVRGGQRDQSSEKERLGRFATGKVLGERGSRSGGKGESSMGTEEAFPRLSKDAAELTEEARERERESERTRGSTTHMSKSLPPADVGGEAPVVELAGDVSTRRSSRARRRESESARRGPNEGEEFAIGLSCGLSERVEFVGSG
jgi:hypothetical protein